jgi:hypothetical protein
MNACELYYKTDPVSPLDYNKLDELGKGGS